MPHVPRLVVVTDRRLAARAGHALRDVVAAAMDGGAPALLLRDKDLDVDARRALGEELRPLVSAAGARLLVSSDVVLARHLDADGVHLATDDPPFEQVRGPTGAEGTTTTDELLVGRSCHDATEVLAARNENVTYVTVSPAAPTRSKPGHGPALGVPRLRALIGVAGGLPLLALGGVTPANVADWRGAGAHGVAVMGGVMAAGDPASVVRSLLSAWDAAPPPEVSTEYPPGTVPTLEQP